MDILGAANFKSGDFRSRDFLNNMSQQLNHGRFQKTMLAFAIQLQHQNTPINYPVDYSIKIQ